MSDLKRNLYEVPPCIECGDGWRELIYNMLLDIDDYFKSRWRQNTFTIHQIKEKWGVMRVYYTTENMDDFEAIDKIVSRYEEGSKTVCELCGKYGTMRKGYPRVRCDECDS